MMAFETYLVLQENEATDGGLVCCPTSLLLPNVEHSKRPPRLPLGSWSSLVGFRMKKHVVGDVSSAGEYP